MTDILPPMPWVYYEYALKKFDSQKYDFFVLVMILMMLKKILMLKI